MAEHVTRCPHCQTSFRVRDEHLSVARGNVRCGSCLQVFNATEYFVVEKPAVPTPPSPPVLQPEDSAASVAGQPVGAAAVPSAAATSSKDDSDYSGVNLDDQTEVSADELFDSMFGGFDDEPSDEPDDVFELIAAKEKEDSLAVPTSSFVLSQKESFQDAYAAMMNPKPAPVPEPEEYDDDNLLIHDDMDNDHIADDPFADLGLREPEMRKRPAPLASIDIDESLLDGIEPEHHIVTPAKKAVTQADDDEAWARALLDEENDEPPETIRRELGLTSAKPAAAVKPAAVKPAPAAAPVKPATATKPVSAAARSAAPDMATAPTAARSATAQSTAVQSTTAQSTAARSATAQSTTAQSAAAQRAARPESLRVEPSLTVEQPAAATSKTDSLLGAPLTDSTPKPAPVKPREVAGNLQPEPLKLALPSRNRMVARWFWGSVVLVMLGALQVFYFNFAEWSRTPQWRPFYTQVCGYAGCTLPTVQDLNTLKSSQLVVRSHPALANALVVDSLLTNEAEFAQPFPDMTLVFRDLDNNVVASRRFSPDEYLSGEVAGTQLIPGQTEVHVALDILDPGQNAVSYSINLVANQ